MNAMIIDDTTTPARPASRIIAPYLQELRCEFLRALRNPGIAVPVLIMPVGLYLLFALVIAGEAIDKDPGLGVFMFAAFSIMAVTMPGLFGAGVTLALERDMGLMRLKRAQPAPAGSWLAGKIGCSLILSMLAYLPLLALALATGKLHVPPAAILTLSLTLVVCALPFYALGLAIGSLVSGSAAPAWANLIYLPGCYLSGMFFPLPKSMYWQTPIWPQFHVQQLVMHVAGIQKMQFEPILVAVATLLGYSVMFSAIAIFRLARKG